MSQLVLQAGRCFWEEQAFQDRGKMDSGSVLAELPQAAGWAEKY
jgi:hypothetical protein